MIAAHSASNFTQPLIEDVKAVVRSVPTFFSITRFDLTCCAMLLCAGCRDVTWQRSSYSTASAQVGVEIGPRVFFVQAAVPPLQLYLQLLPPATQSNGSVQPLPAVALGSVALPPTAFQLLMNRYTFLLQLDTPDPVPALPFFSLSIAADCLLCGLVAGHFRKCCFGPIS